MNELELQFQEFKTSLSKIHFILNTSNNLGQAKYVNKILDFIDQKNILEFQRSIKTADMWGGAGAVWEVFINDNLLKKEFQLEIIHLIDIMNDVGLTNESIKFIKTAFQKILSKYS